MAQARLRSEREPFESLLRRFKRNVEKDGLLQELRNREFFEKPSAKRKKSRISAIKRQRKITELEKMTPEEKKLLAKREESKRNNNNSN